MLDRDTETLLEKHLPACPQVVAARSLKHDIDALIDTALPGLRLAIIDDRNTAAALGDQVFRALKNRAAHLTLPGTPHADTERVESIRHDAAACDALVAVGSGTINDLCKYAAFLDRKPYVVFPTAASMNGYLSANASISEKGYKKTCAAQMPKAVFCDLSAIAAAPARLSRSGLGDSLARPTAQADWLLSHILLDTPYDETPFALLAPVEPQLFDSARGIGRNDPASIELLLKALLLSGLGMTIAKGSYPASQGEHMIAHAMEMLGATSALHGEGIAVTTLFMAKLQQETLRRSPALRFDDFNEQKITELFGAKVAGEAKKAFGIKAGLIRKHDTSLRDWESVADRIARVMLPPARIAHILDSAGLAGQPEDLKWRPETYNIATAYARFLRERLTFLDLSG